MGCYLSAKSYVILVSYCKDIVAPLVQEKRAKGDLRERILPFAEGNKEDTLSKSTISSK